MRVDGPPGPWAQVRRQVIAQAVVDIEVKVESLAGNTIQFAGLEMFDLDDLPQRTQAIAAGGLGPLNAVEDERDATDGHRSILRERSRVVPQSLGEKVELSDSA